MNAIPNKFGRSFKFDDCEPRVMLAANFYKDLSNKVSKNTLDLTSGATTEQWNEAITKLSTSGGGILNVGSGKYELSGVNLASDVHIRVNNKATLIHNGETNNLFNLGSKPEGPDADAAPTIKNVSIQSAGEGQFQVDLRAKNNPQQSERRAVAGYNVENFNLSNFKILDNKTALPGVALTFAGENSKDAAVRPTNGNIQNITQTGSAYGFGTVQVQAGKNISLRNIRSVGGSAVRLEADFPVQNISALNGPQGPSGSEGISNVNINGAYVTNGQTAVALQPAGLKNGRVIANNIKATNSNFALTISDSFIKDANRYTPQQRQQLEGRGSFDAKSKFTNISAVFGAKQETRASYLRFLPGVQGPADSSQTNNTQDSTAYSQSIGGVLNDSENLRVFDKQVKLSGFETETKPRQNEARRVLTSKEDAKYPF